MRAEPTKCWFVSKRKQARHAWLRVRWHSNVCNSKLQQKCVTVRPMKRTSSPEGCITVPSGSRAGVAVVNKVFSWTYRITETNAEIWPTEKATNALERRSTELYSLCSPTVAPQTTLITSFFAQDHFSLSLGRSSSKPWTKNPSQLSNQTHFNKWAINFPIK